MKLKSLTIDGFKSFGKKSTFQFKTKKTAIVGPNGSGKSNVVEAIRFVLGEQSMKSLRSGSASDLLFRGVKDNVKIARIALVFDNTDGDMKIPILASANKNGGGELWSEITIERVISDEGSSYVLNGSEVRLKDISELLLGMHISSSGYHIINQGEADRLLLASARERRVMLEEALGLRLIAGRIKESERKLERTRENLSSLSLLQRELSPELTYLKKQVEKIKDAEQNRNALYELAKYYLDHEYYAVANEESSMTDHVRIYEMKCELLIEETKILESVVEYNPDSNSDINESIHNQEHIIEVLKKEEQSLLMDEQGLKTHVQILNREIETYEKNKEQTKDPVISIKHNYLKNIHRILVQFFDKPSSISDLKEECQEIIQYLSQFISKSGETHEIFDTSHQEVKKEIEEKQFLIENINVALSSVRDAIARERELIIELQQKKEESFKDIRAKQSEYFSKKEELTRLQFQIENIKEKLQQIYIKKSNIVDERKHYEHISAHSLADYVAKEDGLDNEYNHYNTKRALEKLVFKIEEVGGGSGIETINEFEDLQQRYNNYHKEINDLSESAVKIESIIGELSLTMKKEFNEGLVKVSDHFQDFFSAMFGGGTAAIVTVAIPRKQKEGEEGAEVEEGIDIELTLPKKQTQSLTTLSGGERSLTSIALLFALSQINPPPFLILDETDAALDEANSKRYGDMLERLSAYSQIIVVTHNRETMSRADVLYGVTLEKTGSSMLLSVSFDDAVQYAK